MEVTEVIDYAREAVWIAMLVASPLLLVALLTGLTIGIIQAATSINEMTLSFIPKLATIALALVVFGGWQLRILIDFVTRVFERIPGMFL